MASNMSKAARSKRLAPSLIGAGMLSLALITAGLLLLSDTEIFHANTNPEELRFRNLSTEWRQLKQLTLTIHKITISKDNPTNLNGFYSELSFRFNFSRVSGNGQVDTSSRVISAGYAYDTIIEVNQNLPTTAFANLDERALFYAVESDEALGIDVYATSEHWGSGNVCPSREESQHYFTAPDRFGLGAHKLRHRCTYNGFTIEYVVDYTIQEWNPQLTIREVWLGSSYNSGVCYQAVNQGTTPSWYYTVNVHLDSASSEQPIISSPPLYPLKAGQEIVGCLGLPRLEEHARNSLRVELKQLYDSKAGKTNGGE